MSDIRVAVLHQHRLIAEGLANFIRVQPGIAAVLVVPAAADAWQAVRWGHAVLVVDEARSADILGRSAQPVIVILDRSDADVTVRLLYEGASGVCTQFDAVEDVVQAVRLVAAGQTRLPALLVGPVLSRMTSRATGEPDSQLASLTRREVQVLRLLGGGATRTEIATELTLSPHTVRTHIQNVLTKLSLHSQLEASAYARKAFARHDRMPRSSSDVSGGI